MGLSQGKKNRPAAWPPFIDALWEISVIHFAVQKTFAASFTLGRAEQII